MGYLDRFPPNLLFLITVSRSKEPAAPPPKKSDKHAARPQAATRCRKKKARGNEQ